MSDKSPIIDGSELLQQSPITEPRVEYAFYYSALNERGFGCNIVTVNPETDTIYERSADIEFRFADGQLVHVLRSYLWMEKRTFTVKVKAKKAATPVVPAGPAES